VSALAFTPSLFTLEWTHPPNCEQPDGAADLLNTNSHSQYYARVSHTKTVLFYLKIQKKYFLLRLVNLRAFFSQLTLSKYTCIILWCHNSVTSTEIKS